jgi:hypothetical protein
VYGISEKDRRHSSSSLSFSVSELALRAFPVIRFLDRNSAWSCNLWACGTYSLVNDGGRMF